MNMKETVSRIAIIGGLLTSGGAVADFSQNKALFDELSKKDQIDEVLREKYRIEVVCFPHLTGDVTCSDDVNGDYTPKEKHSIYHQYQEEYAKKAKEVSDPSAEARGIREAGAFVFGSLLATAGAILRKKPRTK